MNAVKLGIKVEVFLSVEIFVVQITDKPTVYLVKKYEYTHVSKEVAEIRYIRSLRPN